MHVDGSTAEASKESVPKAHPLDFGQLTVAQSLWRAFFDRERKMDGRNRVMACQAAGVQPPHGRLHRHGPLVKLCVFLRRRKTPSAQPFLWTAKTPSRPFLGHRETPLASLFTEARNSGCFPARVCVRFGELRAILCLALFQDSGNSVLPLFMDLQNPADTHPDGRIVPHW